MAETIIAKLTLRPTQRGQVELRTKEDTSGQESEKKETCGVCGSEPQVMAFKGSGVCSELCRKQRDGDTGTHRARG